MKTFINLIILFSVWCIIIPGIGCTSSSKTENLKSISADTIMWRDTLSVCDEAVIISIAGEYPLPGESYLRDSLRAWLGERLVRCVLADTAKLFIPDQSELVDGSELIARVGDSIKSFAKERIESGSFEAKDRQYEFEIAFKKVYESEKLLTYSFKCYNYIGGARGETVYLSQTFVRKTGEKLTWNNSFRPEFHYKLMELVREELWTQYFSPRLADWLDEGNPTLNDVLMVNPDKLELPISAPEFRENGVIFRYQMYHITHYAAGMPSCIISYRKLIPLMTPEACRLLPGVKSPE